MRTISDNANEEAAVDFMRFVQTVASPYAFTVIQQLCQRLAGLIFQLSVHKKRAEPLVLPFFLNKGA